MVSQLGGGYSTKTRQVGCANLFSYVYGVSLDGSNDRGNNKIRDLVILANWFSVNPTGHGLAALTAGK